MTDGIHMGAAAAYLERLLYTQTEVDAWFDGQAFGFASHHSELGWLLQDGCVPDGVDGSWSRYTYAPEAGERVMLAYADTPCRINTYGDSYTQCHQVSDHETWQEVLAGHLQEPVRNFGIGGWSLYQAYRRMLIEEQRTPAEYLIVNIFQDDHRRNLDAWRNIRVPKHPAFIEPTLPYLAVDVAADTVRECANPCPTRESYVNLCDLDTAMELFADDFVLGIMLTHQASRAHSPYRAFGEAMALTQTHGIETRVEEGAHLSQAAEELHVAASLRASRWVVDQIDAYAENTGRQVLYVLSYPAHALQRWLLGHGRWDQPFVDWLSAGDRQVVDLGEAHRCDYAAFAVDVPDYLARYKIGHYNPQGNAFCAQQLIPALRGLLNPAPAAYR